MTRERQKDYARYLAPHLGLLIDHCKTLEGGLISQGHLLQLLPIIHWHMLRVCKQANKQTNVCH